MSFEKPEKNNNENVSKREGGQEAIETRVEQLERENTKLREENEKLKDKIERQQQEIDLLEHESIRDQMTNLYNRAYFEPRLEESLKILDKPVEKRREEAPSFEKLSVAFFDIDNFKQINDTYGHEVGDDVLKKVGQTLENNMRSGDIVSRWGGEELVICLFNASEGDARHKAEELREKVEALDFGEYSDLKVTLSVGVSSAKESKSSDEIIKEADDAMYEAKGSGKNQVLTYSEYLEKQKSQQE